MKLISFLLLIQTAFASELYLTEQEAITQGYRPVKIGKEHSVLKPNRQKLAWPFEKPYHLGFLGNNFSQRQPYQLPGYHFGLDMILEKGSWSVAPISGKLEAGHYTYTDNPNGTSNKFWKPWPKEGEAAYFEVAIIDDNGYRYEFHHLDRDSLPEEIIQALESEDPRVQKGQRLGKVYNWSFTPFHYHHVHLNVVAPNGEHYNPEWYFETLPDTIKPEVKVLLQYASGRTVELLDGNLRFMDDELAAFILITYDQKDNNIYTQAPTFIELRIDNKVQSSWDFRHKARGVNGLFADIRDVYPEEITMPDGSILKQRNDYYPNNAYFIMRLPVKNKSNSIQTFKVTLMDNANNSTIFKGAIAK